MLAVPHQTIASASGGYNSPYGGARRYVLEPTARGAMLTDDEDAVIPNPGNADDVHRVALEVDADEIFEAERKNAPFTPLNSYFYGNHENVLGCSKRVSLRRRQAT